MKEQSVGIGRKIIDAYENPIDNHIIALAERLNTSIFRPLNFTPNMITSLSLICGVFSAIVLYNNQYIVSAILFTVAYILDCADGNYARTYNMVTTFGDYYDHVSDVLKIVIILIVMSQKQDVSRGLRLFFVFGTFFMFALSSVHLGCQERLYNPLGQDSLSVTKKMCIWSQPEKLIKITRYFGVGTFIAFIVGFILYMSYTSR